MWWFQPCSVPWGVSTGYLLVVALSRSACGRFRFAWWYLGWDLSLLVCFVSSNPWRSSQFCRNEILVWFSCCTIAPGVGGWIVANLFMHDLSKGTAVYCADPRKFQVLLRHSIWHLRLMNDIQENFLFPNSLSLSLCWMFGYWCSVWGDQTSHPTPWSSLILCCKINSPVGFLVLGLSFLVVLFLFFVKENKNKWKQKQHQQ